MLNCPWLSTHLVSCLLLLLSQAHVFVYSGKTGVEHVQSRENPKTCERLIANGSYAPGGAIDPGFGNITYDLAEIKNGSSAILPNCNVTECDTSCSLPLLSSPRKRSTSTDSSLSSKDRKLKRISNRRCNPNFLRFNRRQMFIQARGSWYIRTLNTTSGHISLQMIRSTNPGPAILPSVPNAIEPNDAWDADWIVPPWLIREFAQVNRCNARAGRQVDLEDLYNLLSDHESLPSWFLNFMRSPLGNFYGADSRMIYLRTEALLRRQGLNVFEGGVNLVEHEARALYALMYVDDTHSRAWSNNIKRIANWINQRYPFSSPLIGREFITYMEQIYFNARIGIVERISGPRPTNLNDLGGDPAVPSISGPGLESLRDRSSLVIQIFLGEALFKPSG